MQEIVYKLVPGLQERKFIVLWALSILAQLLMESRQNAREILTKMLLSWLLKNAIKYKFKRAHAAGINQGLKCTLPPKLFFAKLLSRGLDLSKKTCTVLR